PARSSDAAHPAGRAARLGAAAIRFQGPLWGLGGASLAVLVSAAMLQARAMGESFGLACAEFSICNKPVVTWFASRDRYHIDVLRERGIYYCDKGDLLRILLSFAPRAGDYDAYSQRFDPLTIMRIFDSVFLEPARRAKQNELRYLDGALASPLGAALTASVNVQGVPDGGSASVLAYQF
nr:hypothetical protein [Planctomycetota bacterium]